MGILLMVVQSCLSLYGTTLMRLSHVRTQELERGFIKIEELRSYSRPRTMWWVGIIAFVGSQFLMPFALALAPMSLLAPLSSCGILINLVMAYFILGEDVSKWDLLATVCCGVCAFGVMFFGPKGQAGNGDGNKNEQVAFVGDIITKMDVWGMVFLMSALSVTIVSFTLYKLRARINWEAQKYFIMPWMHCSLAAFGLIFTKGLGAQILDLQNSDDVLKSVYQLIITGLCIGACSPGSAYFQVRATEEFDARWFIPMKFAGNVVLQLFLGAAAFHEWDNLSTGSVVLFLTFSLFCVASVLFINPKDSLKEKLDAAKEDGYEPIESQSMSEVQPQQQEIEANSGTLHLDLLERLEGGTAKKPRDSDESTRAGSSPGSTFSLRTLGSMDSTISKF